MENTIYDIKRRIDKVKLQLANKSNNVESDQSIEQKRKTLEQFQNSTVSALKDDASPNQRANDNNSLVNMLRQRIAVARTNLQLIK